MGTLKRLDIHSSMMKIAILAALLAAVATVVLPEMFTQESSVATKNAPASCTDALLKSGGDSGSTFRCSGPGPRAGHPIVNIHGQGMNSQKMEFETGVSQAALAGKKYIVISPEDWDNSWEFAFEGQHDDAALVGDFLLKKALVVYKDIVDTKRVHSTGFSAGAINSFDLLCKHSAQICSVAGIGFSPLGQYQNYANGKYFPGVHNCWNTNAGGSGPTHKRSLMVHQGTTDIYFQGQAKNALENSATAVKGLYGITGDGEKLHKGAGVDWTRYTGGGVTFESASYKFSNPGVIKGHCIPKAGTATSSAIAYPHTVTCGADAADNVAGYTWGVEAIKFFEANPCA